MRKQLAKPLAASTDIDTTSGTEQTEWVKPAAFPGRVAHFAGDKDKVVKKAKRDSYGLNEQSFWIDGSHLNIGRTEVNLA